MHSNPFTQVLAFREPDRLLQIPGSKCCRSFLYKVICLRERLFHFFLWLESASASVRAREKGCLLCRNNHLMSSHEL